MGGGKIVRNNLLVGTFLSLALGAASCTNETEQLTDSRSVPMSIQVSNHIASRAGLITSATLPIDEYGIGVTLVNKSDKAPYDGQTGYANTQWTTANGSTWSFVGTTNPNLTGTEGVAVAYYPYSSSATDYTAIPVESASQTDYMYSGWSNDLTNATPQAEFTMQHALAAVRVKLAVSANYSGDKSATAVTIASDGFMASASLNAETGALTAKTGAGAEHTQEELALELDATGKDVDFLVIPADAPAEITFLATIGDKQYSASVTPAEALAQGLIHTYTLTLSAEGMKVSTVDVTPWGDGQTGSDELKPYVDPTPHVYAVSATGELIDYKTADATALGVALVAGEHKFMIAKTDATDGTNNTLYWGKSYSDLSLTNYSNADGTNSYGSLPKPDGTFGGSTHLSGDFATWTDGALSDFNGKANTAVIAAASSNARDMCTVLNTFNTSDSFKDWYVPACGQLALIYLNMTEINKALAKIGGTALFAGYYWSSTESGAGGAWRMYFDKGAVDNGDKVNTDIRVRFVRDIN